MVTNLSNGRKVNVRVNDRGPFVSSRIIDLSLAAAQMLDMVTAGTAPVLIQALDGQGQAADSAYWAETNSYARSEGGNSSASSQLTAPPYPAYQNNSSRAPEPAYAPLPQEPVVVQVQPPQQQITQYFQQPVQPVQQQQAPPSRYPSQSPQVQQLPPMQQVQPVQQVLPVQQVQQAVQPMQPLVQPVIVSPPPQTPSAPPVQEPPANPPPAAPPLQIQIPIELRPVVSAGPYPPASAAGTPAPPAATSSPAASPPVAVVPVNPPVTVIFSPEAAPPAALPPIQVTVKPNSIYRVQVGSFKEARNALAAFERLKGAGLNPVYERNGDFFRVVLSGISSEEMAGVLQKIQGAGFNDPLLREER
jgi:hypothetical protein